jgi:hypothetical protein
MDQPRSIVDTQYLKQQSESHFSDYLIQRRFKDSFVFTPIVPSQIELEMGNLMVYFHVQQEF